MGYKRKRRTSCKEHLATVISMSFQNLKKKMKNDFDSFLLLISTRQCTRKFSNEWPILPSPILRIKCFVSNVISSLARFLIFFFIIASCESCCLVAKLSHRFFRSAHYCSNIKYLSPVAT